ncbi:MAG: YbaB/EbfC family nucleoid-associated protein [Clostridia bacterium]|nr:YbaB/EbfC family nucleoid-associated protein [Clostridia bacterium]MBQ2963414.1 YbaB/EbfC family nucleoid-associated protein [Clostridia bacterium]MBQ7101259.1 YbaB/EbfC family nucleoid-associated protein [Clostridia bacterium]MBR3755255.1 YbaB/EbfC family nucleoid-associated protein [Clostridia bacterium]
MKARIPGAPQGGQAAMLQRLQDMQAEMQRTQEEVEATDYVASAGGGAVEATVTGAKVLKDIKIDPEVVDPEDVEMLQDMVIAAVNEALRKAEDAMMQGMEKAKGGLNIPGLF